MEVAVTHRTSSSAQDRFPIPDTFLQPSGTGQAFAHLSRGLGVHRNHRMLDIYPTPFLVQRRSLKCVYPLASLSQERRIRHQEPGSVPEESLWTKEPKRDQVPVILHWISKRNPYTTSLSKSIITAIFADIIIIIFIILTNITIQRIFIFILLFL